MEIAPVAGLSIVPLPNGQKAIVLVEIASAKNARRIAKALTAKPPTPSSEQGTSS
jgi:hypothetical protein